MVYRTEREKFNALCEEIEARNKKGQPVLVGTVVGGQERGASPRCSSGAAFPTTS